MKAITIHYEKCFALGNYEHEKIGIELEVEQGERAEAVLKAAKRFVHETFEKIKQSREKLISDLNYKVSHPEDYTGREVSAAQEQLNLLEKGTTDDLPF